MKPDPPKPPVSNPTSDDSRLEDLRHLILGDEEDLLHRLQQRVEDQGQRAKDISQVLPEAILLRQQQDSKLHKALAPVVEQGLKDSIRKDPRPMADALAPTLGMAIRKAITQALRGMVESLNRALEHSFSVQGLKWRFEAVRTGKPFAEILLLRSLRYRVEQVFLIHKETGLLLAHEATTDPLAPNGDLVSGMLTAIRDFVADSFGTKDRDALQTLEVGDYSVWVEPGPFAVIAVVIRGQAPATLKKVLQETIESIHIKQGNDLADFSGDTKAFDAAGPDLRDCLLSQDQGETQAKKISPVLILLAALLVTALTLWGVFSLRQSRRWDAFVESLRQQPGIVVIATGSEEGRYQIRGLLDPLAVDPEELLSRSLLADDKVVMHWEPYQALHAAFIEQRARRMLRPPESVHLLFDKGTLRVRGSAPATWLDEAERLAPLVPGIEQLDSSELQLSVSTQSLSK